MRFNPDQKGIGGARRTSFSGKGGHFKSSQIPGIAKKWGGGGPAPCQDFSVDST